MRDTSSPEHEECGRFDLVKHFVEAGCNPTTCNSSGKLPPLNTRILWWPNFCSRITSPRIAARTTAKHNFLDGWYNALLLPESYKSHYGSTPLPRWSSCCHYLWAGLGYSTSARLCIILWVPLPGSHRCFTQGNENVSV